MNIAPSLPIKEIPDIPPEIFSAWQSGKLVVFVGAGVSRLTNNAPSWEGLADCLLKQAAEKEGCDFSFSDINQIAASIPRIGPRTRISIAEQVFGGRKFKFEEAFKDFKPDETYPIFKTLYKISACFVTTNYDQFLDKAVTVSKPPPVTPGAIPIESKIKSESVVFFKPKDLTASRIKPPNILHLHGSMLDPESMVLTTKDYLDSYAPEGPRTQFLKELFSSDYTILFIGYGLDEDDILEHVVKKGELQNNKMFRLFPVFSNQQRFFNLMDGYSRTHCCTRLIPYAIDRHGELQLEAVISAWAALLGRGGYLETIKLLDEVLNEEPDL